MNWEIILFTLVSIVISCYSVVESKNDLDLTSENLERNKSIEIFLLFSAVVNSLALLVFIILIILNSKSIIHLKDLNYISIFLNILTIATTSCAWDIFGRTNVKNLQKDISKALTLVMIFILGVQVEFHANLTGQAMGSSIGLPRNSPSLQFLSFEQK